MRKPLALLIVDGWGLADTQAAANPFSKAQTPFINSLFANYPHTALKAAGEAVGLPQGQMGNSEVGHLNIGAGRVVYQDYTLINQAVANNQLMSNSVLIKSLQDLKKRGGALHLVGLVSDGGVHSHLKHLFALLEVAKVKEVSEVFIHAILDGRDVSPRSALKYLKQVQAKIKALKLGQIATIGGRYYYMDRDQRWERIKLAYQAMAKGEGPEEKDEIAVVEKAYQQGIDDEFIKPTVLLNRGISAKDCVLFFNFRADRARQLTKAFTMKDFDLFPLKQFSGALDFITMTEYDQEFDLPVLFPPQNIKEGLGEVLSKANLRQLRIAETEKYAHVTFFFNGGQEKKYPLEIRELIPSPAVATYDLQPEMSAYPLTQQTLKLAQAVDVIILNYANLDMIGHTGKFEQAVMAIEIIDKCLQQLTKELLKEGYQIIITSDHGNIEQMKQLDQSPHTAHTSNLVPFILMTNQKGIKLRTGGGLADIAPTILELLNLEPSQLMTGKSLLK